MLNTGTLNRGARGAAWSLVAAACVAAGACKKSGDGDDESDSTKAVVAVQTALVTAQGFTETVGAIGTVAPRAGHTASLSAPAQGRVLNVLATAGQTVRANQPLIELDPAPFQANAQSAQAALETAQRAYERQSRLAGEGIVARKDVEQAAADLAKARSDAVTASRQVEQATLRSPISGVVTRMSASLGAMVDASQPLVDIADPNAVDILFNLTPTDAARVGAGAKVTVSAGQNATGEPLGVATVVDVAGTVDSASRSVAARAEAPTTRRPLRIGETVFGQIAVRTVPTALVVPVDALVPEDEGFKVFVVDANGIAHARDVTVGGRTAAVAEILTGLRAGERVVTYGAYGVQDSAKVVPLQAAPNRAGAPSKTDTTKPDSAKP
jgi:RND family efflux transporter MFP subunit